MLLYVAGPNNARVAIVNEPWKSNKMNHSDDWRAKYDEAERKLFRKAWILHPSALSQLSHKV